LAELAPLLFTVSEPYRNPIGPESPYQNTRHNPARWLWRFSLASASQELPRQNIRIDLRTLQSSLKHFRKAPP